MRKMDGAVMLNWFRSLFKPKETSSGHYAVLVRGVQVYETTTLEDAEGFIRETFERIDSGKKGGRGFSSTQGVGKRRRWNGYRGQCKIIKISS
jgi:hypothetical protein